MFFETVFDYSTRPQVVVISDSAYKQAQKQQLETELTAMQSKANRYRSALQDLELAIAAKEKEVEALAEAETKKSV